MLFDILADSCINEFHFNFLIKILPAFTWPKYCRHGEKPPKQSVNQKVSISTGVCDNETNLEYTLSCNKNE